MGKRVFRTIWLSDTHLGSRDVNSSMLFDFLKQTESEYLYLVGDIIDLWKLKGRWHWPPINDRIVALVLEKARTGTKVVYIPGNHDEALRAYAGSQIDGITFRTEAVHETAAGQRFLVLHGDEFDSVVQNRKWLAKAGGIAYDYLLLLNRHFNSCRHKLGLGYWSLSAFLKHRVKEAVNFMGRFEEIIVREIRNRQVAGLICGHLHHAAIKDMDGFIYSNIGDWVESCTALTEAGDGTLGLIHWSGAGARLLEPQREQAKISSFHQPVRLPGGAEPASWSALTGAASAKGLRLEV